MYYAKFPYLEQLFFELLKIQIENAQVNNMWVAGPKSFCKGD